MQKECEGICLRAVAFKESSRIITIFSREEGLLSLIVKGVTKKNLARRAITEPLLSAEWIYKPGKSELGTFLDGTIIDPGHRLRCSLSCLTIAGQMASDLIKTQLPGKPNSQLYALLIAFLKKLPTSKNPELLGLAFRLKLLILEGELYYDGTLLHAGSEAALPASSEQVSALKSLSEERKFTGIEEKTLPSGSKELIEKLLSIKTTF